MQTQVTVIRKCNNPASIRTSRRLHKPIQHNSKIVSKFAAVSVHIIFCFQQYCVKITMKQIVFLELFWGGWGGICPPIAQKNPQFRVCIWLSFLYATPNNLVLSHFHLKLNCIVFPVDFSHWSLKFQRYSIVAVDFLAMMTEGDLATLILYL